MPRKPYYHAYDDRYRRVYAQGVEYWTANPEELRDTRATLDAFLAELAVEDPLVLECGCGEGHLAVHLIGQGYHYIGTDISPAALDKARARVAALPQKANATLHLADSLRLDCVGDASIDVVVDNYHFHMFVPDGDRARYLQQVHRVLKPGGFAYFRENYAAKPPVGPFVSLEQYVEATGADFTRADEREAWQDGKAVRIELPRLPSRANNQAGYEAELAAANLAMTHFAVAGPVCIMHARRRGA